MSVGLLQFQPMELILIPGLIVLASAVGYLPAMAAYRTDVAQVVAEYAVGEASDGVLSSMGTGRLAMLRVVERDGVASCYP